MRALVLVPLAGLWAALTACTGFTFGENRPGADTFVDDAKPHWDVEQGVYRGTGSIAVDDRTDRAYALQTTWAGSEDHGYEGEEPLKKELLFVDPALDTTRVLATMTGHDDIRVLFPASGVLTMAEVDDEHDVLTLHDRSNGRVLQQRTVDARYHGTRMSPSRRWIAVADNAARTTHAPIHVLDAATLEARVIPHDGDWLEAQWLNGHDVLLAVVFYVDGPQAPSARLLGWSFEGGAPWEGRAIGRWAEPTIDVPLPGARPDALFSMTWLGVAPNDRTVVVPVRVANVVDEGTRDEDVVVHHELMIVDTVHRSVRRVVGAKGPVGFTPSGDTIVSYGGPIQGTGPYAEGAILLIDRVTLDVTPVETPWGDTVSYWVSRTNELVVATPPLGSRRLLLLDADTLETTIVPVGTPDEDGEGDHWLGLDEFAVREAAQEAWLVGSDSYPAVRGTLDVLDLLAGTLTAVPWASSEEVDVRHVAVLPKSDRVLIGGQGEHAFFRIDPGTREAERTITIAP